jgi:hypothetical protein
LFGQLPADEHQGVDMVCRVVEHVQCDEPARWLDRVGWAIVAAAGDAMGELALAPEPGQHVCR